MDFTQLFWDRNESIPLAGTGVNARLMGLASPSVIQNEKRFIRAVPGNNKALVVKGGTYIKLSVPGSAPGTHDHWLFGTEEDLIIPYTEQRLDTGVSFQPGKDYYIYMCYKPATPVNPVPWADIVISLNSTYPQDFDANTSRKIGGFHTLCASVGTLPNNPIDDVPHPASGFMAGEIIPNSVWCITHRSAGMFQEGTAYVDELDEWHWIYLQSGIGRTSRSVYGGTVTKSRVQVQHQDDLLRVGYQLQNDSNFQLTADGSNAKTSIQGAAGPITTGGHIDSAGRRMISKYFLEDMCGAYWHWLSDLGFNGQTNWATVPDNLGDTYGVPYALLAGGPWDLAAYAGPRCRFCNTSRLTVNATYGARGCARSR